MPIHAAVVSLLLAAPPPASAATIGQDKIFELGVSLSAAVIYRMDSMPAELHKNGADMLRHARMLATQTGLPLTDDAVLRGPQSDTLEAMGYVMNSSAHPTARFLQEKQGRPAAALFELGLLSHLAMTGASGDTAKSLADSVEAAAKDSGVPREKWVGLVDAYRTGQPKNARIDAMANMLQAVGRSLPKSAATR